MGSKAEITENADRVESEDPCKAEEAGNRHIRRHHFKEEVNTPSGMLNKVYETVKIADLQV